MSQRLYCPTCSQPTSFDGIPPKFCSQCSEPFLSSTKKPVRTAIAKVTANVTEEDLEDDPSIPNHVPNINRLDVELDGEDINEEEDAVSSRKSRHSLEQLLTSSNPPAPKKRGRPAKQAKAKSMSEVDRNKFIEAYKLECSPAKRGI